MSKIYKKQIIEAANMVNTYEEFCSWCNDHNHKTPSRRTYFLHRKKNDVPSSSTDSAITKIKKATAKLSRAVEQTTVSASNIKHLVSPDDFVTIAPTFKAEEDNAKVTFEFLEKLADAPAQLTNAELEALKEDVKFFESKCNSLENDIFRLKEIHEHREAIKKELIDENKALLNKCDFLQSELDIITERSNDKASMLIWGVIGLILVLTFKNAFEVFSTHESSFTAVLLASVFALSGVALSQKAGVRKIALVISAVCAIWECILSASVILGKLSYTVNGAKKYSAIVEQFALVLKIESEYSAIVLSVTLAASISVIFYACLYTLFKK